MILENVHSVKVKVLELGDTTEHSALAANHVAEILGNLPLIQVFEHSVQCFIKNFIARSFQILI